MKTIRKLLCLHELIFYEYLVSYLRIASATSLRKLALMPPSILTKSSIAYLIVNIDCQLQRTKSYPGDKFLGMSASESLERINWDGKTHSLSKCEQHHCLGWGPRLNYKEKENWTPGFNLLCFLTVDAIWPAASSSHQYAFHHGISPSIKLLWVRSSVSATNNSICFCICKGRAGRLWNEKVWWIKNISEKKENWVWEDSSEDNALSHSHDYQSLHPQNPLKSWAGMAATCIWVFRKQRWDLQDRVVSYHWNLEWESTRFSKTLCLDKSKSRQ